MFCRRSFVGGLLGLFAADGRQEAAASAAPVTPAAPLAASGSVQVGEFTWTINGGSLPAEAASDGDNGPLCVVVQSVAVAE